MDNEWVEASLPYVNQTEESASQFDRSMTDKAIKDMKTRKA